MEAYRSGHNELDSKHSRVRHTLLFETPLFIGVYATCICTFRNLHLAVFSQFGNLALPLQFYMETYRSGHNGADSKSVSAFAPASSNLAVSAKELSLAPLQRLLRHVKSVGWKLFYFVWVLLEGLILQGVFSFYPKAEPIAIALAFLLSLSMWL